MKRNDKLIRDLLNIYIVKDEPGTMTSNISDEEVRYQFDLMVSDGLIERVDDGSNPERITWNITPQGRDFCEKPCST